MGNFSFHTNIIKVGNSTGIRIPERYGLELGEKVVVEKTDNGLLIRPDLQVARLKDWDKLFQAADLSADSELDDWDITLADGIE